MNCPDCLYFKPMHESKDSGFCRKNAPKSQFYNDGSAAPYWPHVAVTDLCGELHEKPKDSYSKYGKEKSEGE